MGLWTIQEGRAAAHSSLSAKRRRPLCSLDDRASRDPRGIRTPHLGVTQDGRAAVQGSSCPRKDLSLPVRLEFPGSPRGGVALSQVAEQGSPSAMKRPTFLFLWWGGNARVGISHEEMTFLSFDGQSCVGVLEGVCPSVCTLLVDRSGRSVGCARLDVSREDMTFLSWDEQWRLCGSPGGVCCWACSMVVDQSGSQRSPTVLEAVCPCVCIIEMDPSGRWSCHAGFYFRKEKISNSLNDPGPWGSLSKVGGHGRLPFSHEEGTCLSFDGLSCAGVLEGMCPWVHCACRLLRKRSRGVTERVWPSVSLIRADTRKGGVVMQTQSHEEETAILVFDEGRCLGVRQEWVPGCAPLLRDTEEGVLAMQGLTSAMKTQRSFLYLMVRVVGSPGGSVSLGVHHTRGSLGKSLLRWSCSARVCVRQEKEDLSLSG